MTVLFYVDWANGAPLVGDVYTHNTPDIPDGWTVDTNDSSLVVESASPWNGQTLLDCTASWYRGPVWDSLTSAEVAATRGRIKIEFDIPLNLDPSELMMRLSATTEADFRMRVQWQTGSLIRVRWTYDNFTSDYYIELTFPTNPFSLEIIYDSTQATTANRLRARVWDIGSSAGSFTGVTTTISDGGTHDPTAQPVQFVLDDPNNGVVMGRYGKIIFSDDPDEDLSTWTPGGGSPAVFMGGMSL